jgi:adenosylmethionine-8-amino-7-oxononanoate aminotransferase
MERENLCEHVNDVGDYFETQLKTLEDLEIVGEVRGRKFMMCIENVADKKTKSLIHEDAAVGGRIADHCQKRGLIVRPLAHMNVLSPPLVMTRKEVDKLVAILRESIVETISDLYRDGYL